MNRPPLWEVMAEAVINAPEPQFSPAGTIAAAQIRAVRDWLVPEDRNRPSNLVDRVRWRQRNAIRALLTAEANRAQRGEGTDG